MSNLLLTELRKIQKKQGHISEKAIRKINKKTGIPLSVIYGVATFYVKLHTKPQGKYIIEICNNPSCYLNGSLDLIKFLEKKLKIKSRQTTKDKKFSLHICSCIGCCDEPPAMLLNGKPYTKLTKEKLESIIKKCKS
ncbi:NAD(P)H-dependent oxidoreductase subunit E [Candidatus Woesearchaeota archaeon]|nr:NAD(P)H-dependent oxidoreductase subunit E [Candidatus Woesearchaeota archaeon]